MGYYIEVPPYHTGKADKIIDRYGGEKLQEPPKWADIPEDKALVVVMHNAFFEAAGYAYSEREYDAMTAGDGRERDYVLMDREAAEVASGRSR